jgi:prepilin peptidase CpaA
VSNLLDVILIVAAGWAVYTDVTHRRISNRATFGAAILALGIRGVAGGWPSLFTGVEGWLLGVGLLVIPFIMGWMGAGDVKLLAAFGALGGPEFVAQAALLGCIAGGVMALYCLFREGKLWFTLRHLVIFIRHPLGGALEAKRRMPFGPALAAGAALGLVLTRVTP